MFLENLNLFWRSHLSYTNLRDSMMKRVVKSEQLCKPFNADGAGSDSGDHQSVSPFLPCISADIGVLMNPQKMLCNGANSVVVWAAGQHVHWLSYLLWEFSLSNYA